MKKKDENSKNTGKKTTKKTQTNNIIKGGTLYKRLLPHVIVKQQKNNWSSYSVMSGNVDAGMQSF